MYFYVSRQTEGSSWITAAEDWIYTGKEMTTFQRYVWSLYFATVTFATVGCALWSNFVGRLHASVRVRVREREEERGQGVVTTFQ